MHLGPCAPNPRRRTMQTMMRTQNPALGPIISERQNAALAACVVVLLTMRLQPLPRLRR